MIKSQKNHRIDKAYQHWIVYVETFFYTLLLQLPQLHENKKPFYEIVNQFNNNPTSKFQSTLHHKWHN
jgi:hypothetical protein